MNQENQTRVFPDFSLPSRGVIVNRDLHFNNPQTTTNIVRCNFNSLTDIKPIINNHSLKFGVSNGSNGTNISRTKETFENSTFKPYEVSNWNNSLWYSHLNLDLNYNNNLYQSTNANSPIGPYFAQGLANYPNSTLKEL